ncbi:transporter [Pseudomonas sp. DTU_2021_1001937_2_SI_NGA_ILE_001]|uniref:transporter n=1 Tax=Pseudomonas sp. DTU_2021_1001937_2_SI_NGA_ILE_001 TaxID=3077589 RepID=UPI0028FC1A55|nr:transporter [Pseudomonas sp. DTU_2021_1001937_2_SI_NGA_ILE_001]WNW11006.1 transporter [Pseudomonas sp. DTU_2021_1001937_2_SI_NGA_ILE_001]
MSPSVIALIALSIGLDVAGQIAFKLGLDRLPEMDGGFRLAGFWWQLLGAPLLWAGILAYALEFLVWLAVLSLAPLSLAFPAASLAYCGVVLAGRLVLGEAVSRRRWLGTLIITGGVMLVIASGG